MTENAVTKTTIISLFALALAIFVSVSLISIYHLLTLIAFLLWLKQKEFRFNTLPASAWALLAFVVIQLISTTINFSDIVDKPHSIGIIKYPLIGLAALLIYQNPKWSQNELVKEYSRIAFNLFLFTIILAFFYGLAKAYSGWDFFKSNLDLIVSESPNTRLGGFTDIMRYGYGSAIVLLALLGLLLNYKKWPNLNKNFLAVSFIIGFLGMFMSYTRGAMLGFLIGLPVGLYFLNRKLTLLIGTVSISMITIMITFSLTGGSNSSRFLTNLNNTSDRVRISQYLSAIHALQERPLLGWGPQQLKHHVKEIKKKYKLEFPNYHEHAHNVFLETAANTGIIGLIAFLAWIGLWLKELFTIRNNFAKQMFLPVIVFILVAGQFEMLMMAQTSTLIYFLYAISHMPIFKKEMT